MRKAIFTVAIAATLIGASAFSAAAEEDILGLMREANLNETLVENNNGRVAYRTDAYDAEENIYSSYQYADTNRLVFEMPHEIIIVEDEGVYGFDNDNKMPYARLYLDDAFDNEAFFITNYMWDPAEILIESYEEDGLLVVHTQSMEAGLEEFLKAAGYEWEGEYSSINEYKLDPETYEIMECNYQAFMEGIGTVPMSHVERVTDPAEYEVAKEITDIVFSDDTRTVTIIADPDTDSETVISKTVGKGCRVNVYLSWVHPYLYTDRACTMLLNEEIDPNFDIQLYTRREEIKDVPTQQATDAEMVQCDRCGGWFEAGNIFRNHVCPAADGGNTMQCFICGEWMDESAFQDHLSSAHPGADEGWSDPEMVQCDRCGGWFEAGNVFRNHVCSGQADGGNTMQCYICGEWMDENVFYDHLASAHPGADEGWGEDELVQCDVCGEWFEAGNVFRNHVCISYPEE